MKKSVILLFVLTGTSYSFAQIALPSTGLPKDTVASIGSRIITAKDFLERFELMPWMKKDQKARIEFTKLEFLYSLVAEKLLALEAATQNLGSDSSTVDFQNNLERILVRDELYKQTVQPKIVITDKELREGLSRFPFEIESEVLGILNKKEGELLFKKISQSKNKKATYNYFRDSLFVPIDTITVNFGSHMKIIEDAVYRIGKDTVSNPVEIPEYGLVMFRLLKKYSNIQNANFSLPDRTTKVRSIIQRRKEDSVATKTFADLTSPHRAEARPEVFYAIADSVVEMLKSDSANYASKGNFMFPSSAVASLMEKFSDRKNEFFIISQSGNMTVGEVLIGLGNNNIVFPSLKPEHVQVVLNNNIKTVIQNELIAREGFKKNIQQSENVRHDLSTWIDNRKSWLLMRAIIDTITINSDEIEEEYQKNPEVYGATVMVRLREILVDSTSEAKTIRRKIDAGENFATLAKKHTKRKDWVQNGGESPWVDVKTLGDLGMFAASSKIGEMNGPWKIKEGFTIYSVIERKVLDDSLRSNFSETRQTIERKLLPQKRQKTINQFIGTLAKKYNVTINETALRNVQTTTTNMYTWRHIGFGGRIQAVPQTSLQAEWVYEWLRQEQLNQ